MTRSEDYDLYVRMLNDGCIGKNIGDDLVFARIGEKNGDRRTSYATYRGFVKTRWYAFRTGFSSLWDFIVACGAQTLVFLSPAFIKRLIYRRLLHRPVENSGCAKCRIEQKATTEDHFDHE